MSMELRIGTRGSPLARAQAAIVQERLAASGLVAPAAIRTVVIRTSGDRIQDRSLADIGGKGLFTKEIEEALCDGRIDIAVHSVKDLPAGMPDGLILAGVLPRADPRDALLCPTADAVGALPAGARVGTSSPRRRAILLHLRPDLDIVDFRGNVGTRLAKLEAREVDATLLAVAGLDRLGLMVPFSPLDPEIMLPAGGQGAIGLEIRASDDRARALCDAIGDAASMVAIAAERAFLAALDGSCRTPIAVLARVDGGEIGLDGLVAWPDGSRIVRRRCGGASADAARLGADTGREIKAALPADFFAA
jgi:hydroxymethylbilane synthase